MLLSLLEVKQGTCIACMLTLVSVYTCIYTRVLHAETSPAHWVIRHCVYRLEKVTSLCIYIYI